MINMLIITRHAGCLISDEVIAGYLQPMIRHAELVSASVQTQRVAIVLAAGQKDQITAWKINRTLNRKIVSDKFLERSFLFF